MHLISEKIGAISKIIGQISEDEKTYLCSLALFHESKALEQSLISADIDFQKNI